MKNRSFSLSGSPRLFKKVPSNCYISGLLNLDFLKISKDRKIGDTVSKESIYATIVELDAAIYEDNHFRLLKNVDIYGEHSQQ